VSYLVDGTNYVSSWTRKILKNAKNNTHLQFAKTLTDYLNATDYLTPELKSYIITDVMGDAKEFVKSTSNNANDFKEPEYEDFSGVIFANLINN
jgi:hypothetical protein